MTYRRWELAQATGAPVGYPAHERAHIPFEGRTTSQETYTPKALPHAAPQAGLAEAKAKLQAAEANLARFQALSK